MPNVYFDTNVFDHIDKGYVSFSDVDALRRALANGNLTASISIATVEELLGEWETDRNAAVRKLQVARDLVGFDGMLKEPSDLLTDAMAAYASGVSLSPLMPADQRNIIVSSLHRIAAGETSLGSVTSKSLHQVRLMKKGFRQGMTQSRTEVIPEWEKIVAKEGRNATFEEYWAAGAVQFAEDLVPPSYVDACRARGFDGLLEVRTVRLAVGALMSLIFSQIVGDGRQSRKPQSGDGYDLWHAVLASVADSFVTYDTRFAELLGRVPIDNLRVFSSIPDLLAVRE